MSLALDVVTTAGMLFVVAMGLLVVFGVLKIINFAHGAFLTLGAYAGLVTTGLAVSPWLSWPLAFLVGATAGLLVERLIVRPLYARPLDAILATWGLGIVISQIITLAFGREVQFAASPLTGTVAILGETYSAYRLALLAVAVVLGLAFSGLIEGTRLGLSARAVIMNEDLARGLGIDTSRVRLLTFVIGCGLAALAGALITPLSSVDPNMGVPWLINAFMLVMVAGSSFASLALAALVLGGAQVVVSSYLSPILGGMTIVVMAALVLRLRPAGFGRD
ncbi:MAG: branched-chain amino acid ABC transporter permease [Xanthobacteraceae bacterium]|jgi:branched-chain amino acid transport system permease protein